MSIASHGQPSRKVPSGPLLVHSLQPMHVRGSTTIVPNGGWSASGTQNMQASMGQYSTQAGEPEQPVQASLITARMLGILFRLSVRPWDMGSDFSHCSASWAIT